MSNVYWNIVSVFEKNFEDKDILQRVIDADVVPSGCMRWRSWLRQCTISRQIASSMPDGVTGIFHWYDTGSNQPLTEMNTTNISWGVKAAGAQGWQPELIHVPFVLKSGSLNLLASIGPVQTYTGITLPLLLLRSVRGNFQDKLRNNPH